MNIFRKFHAIFFLPFILIAKLSSAQPDSAVSVNLSFAGDLMCHSVQYDYARVGKDSFDFKPAFREVKKYIEKADLALGNLETVIAGGNTKLSGYPLFNSPEEYLEALSYAGFDILFTSNNHCLDRGKKGLLNTIGEIKKYGMTSVGTFTSSEDRDSIRIKNVKGIRFAFLAYTFGTNGIPLPKGGDYLVNLIDTNLIKRDISKSRFLNADIVVVYFHFGDEYSRKPSAYQKKIAEIAASYGADIIIGSHPHVVQGLEKIKSSVGRLDSVFVAYSLGNFISNQRWRYSDGGLLLNLTVSKKISTGEIYISSVDPLPTWVFKGNTGRKNEYVILPLQDERACDSVFIHSSKDKEDCRNSYFDQLGILSLPKNSRLKNNNPNFQQSSYLKNRK